MTIKLLRLITVLACLVFFANTSQAQSFSFNCARDTIVPACPPNLCITLKGVVPDIHKLSDSYVLNPTTPYPGSCFPVYVAPDDPAGTPTFLTIDDRYTDVINIGFPFSFYGVTYNTLIASTNGYVSFDVSKATLPAHWTINANLPSTTYDRAMIMGPYHDLNPNVTQPTQRIQYQVWGTAPFRRWVLSFYKVPLFGTACVGLFENTHQLILYESTGVIEVTIMSKQTCTGWNSGRAIVGIQDFNRTQGMMAPGRTGLGPTWGSLNMNESWRFVPAGGPSLFKRVELIDFAGTILATGTTTNIGNGNLEVSFPGVCAPAGATTPFIIRSVYEKFDDPAVEIFGTDTVRINRAAGLTGTTSTASASCGTNNGSITVNGVTGGTAPYEYSIDGGATWQLSNIFTGLAAGGYTVEIRDASTLCTRSVPATVTLGGALPANANFTPTACTGVNNGAITITTAGGAGPYTFRLDTGTPQPGTLPFTFSGVSSGIHTVVVTDLSTGCSSNPISVTVTVGPGVDGTAIAAATSCAAATNGSITANATGGTGPYTYQLDATGFQSGSNPYVFSGVSSGTHTITIRDNVGCIRTINNVNVTAGPALTTTANKTDVLCNGGATGTITVTQPLIGTAPYEYSLDAITWQSSNSFGGLMAGPYTVYYREANGCQGSQTITVNEPSALSAAASTVAVVCNGESNGVITATPTGGVGPYQYSLDGGATWQISNIFNMPAGGYTISIRDANNCITTRPVNVTEPAVLNAAAANSPASCDGGDDGVINVTANGGNAGYQYSIDGTTFQSSNMFNVAPGNYTVTVKDNLGCTTTFPTTVILSNNFTLTPQIDPTICESKSTPLSLISNATQYSWTPSTGLSATDIYNPVANPTVTTEYIVTATLGRCSGEDRVIVHVNAAPVPNAGGDGFICYGQTYSLQGSGGTQYSWSPTTYLDDPSLPNATSTPTRDITYTLSILSDVNGCASLTTDQIKIDVTPPIKVKTFPYDTVAYSNNQFQLLVIPSDSDVITYAWTPTTGLSDPTIPNPVVRVGAVGDVVQYRVTTSTIAGCKGEGFITVRVYKGPDIYMITAFSPNGDGKNDKFIPFPVGMKSYKYFRVFNRWGQLLYSSTSLHDGWDGKLMGRDQPSGTYVWMIEGITDTNKIVTKRGTVTLIR